MLTYITIVVIIIIMGVSLIKAFLLNGNGLWFITWQISLFASTMLSATVLQDMSKAYSTDKKLEFYSSNSVQGNNLDCLKILSRAHELMMNSTTPSNKLFLKDRYEGMCNFKNGDEL